jgi:hypothetical protein
MTTATSTRNYDDVGEALRERRPLRPADAYRFLFALNGVNFQPLAVTDPVPLGRQILSAAGLDTRKGHSLFAILENGDFEDVRLDEPFDLRQRGAERFICFDTDRVFKLTLQDHQIAWGSPTLRGAALYTLANLGPDEALYVDVRGGTDRLVEPEELIDLNAPGMERFVSGPKPVLEFEIVVNSRPHSVPGKLVTFDQVVQLAFPGVSDQNFGFSMTYQHADSKPHAGELAAGGLIEVKKKGTIFNVTKTVRS